MTNTTALTIDIDPEQVWSADFRDSTVEVVLHPATDDEPARITAWQPAGITTFGLVNHAELSLWSQRIDQTDSGAYTLAAVVKALDHASVREALDRVLAGWTVDERLWSRELVGVLTDDAQDALLDLERLLSVETLTPARPKPRWFTSLSASSYGGWFCGDDDDAGPWADLDGDDVTWTWWTGNDTATETLTGDDAEHVRALIADAQERDA
jgi:hypothetical protein